jgi:hypothetical protein
MFSWGDWEADDKRTGILGVEISWEFSVPQGKVMKI